jgi:two-component system CheB/CheR fusion protein
VTDREDVEPERDEASATDPASDPALGRLLEKISAEYNFDFREYKPVSLARRLRLRMQQVRVDSFDAYTAYLDRHPGEHVALFNTILINVTAFFRDPEAWKVLAQDVIPRLVDEAGATGALRVWSAGCSSGEEVYSTAMLVGEHLGDRSRNFNVKIYATDVDDEALHAGRQGLYRVEDVKDVPPDLLEKYFTREGQAYRFRRDLRRWCIFGRHNVAQDPPLSHVDLLICRNVLIYFSSDLQDRILARFQYSVREGGFLFMGRAESLLTRSRWFTPHHMKWRIFERTTAPALTVAAVMAQTGTDALAVPTSRPEAPSPLRPQRLVEALPSAVIVIDPLDSVLVWNAAAAVVFDIPPENALGRNFRDLDISYRVEGLRARIEEVKSGHIPSRMENVTFNRRSGELVHVELSIIPILEGTRLLGVAVHGLDATETARTKDQMARVADQHATAIEELQSTNEELETTNEELQSTNEELETTNEELQSTNEELETTVEELQATNAELASVHTELERRSAELKQFDESLRAVLSHLRRAVVVVDRDGIVLTWNDTAERLWGVPGEDVVRRRVQSLPAGSLDARVREAVARVARTGVEEDVPDVPVVEAASAPGTVTVAVAPIRSASGDLIGVMAVAPADDRG